MTDNYANINDEIKQILNDIINRIDGEPSKQTYEIYRTENFHETQSNDGIARTVATQSNPIPPSYSSVIRETPPTTNLNRNYYSVPYQSIGPYCRRVPPPPYAEISTNLPRIFTVSHDSLDDIILGPNPVFVWCSRCYRITFTRVVTERMKFAHVIAITLCVFFCWPCCLLPYCMDSCKNTYHYCSNCNHLIGVYRPW